VCLSPRRAKSDKVHWDDAISLAYSVDADDAFMFHALRVAGVDTRGLAFTHHRCDTSELNALALTGEIDVVAISVGAYPAVAATYLLLPHGASVGRGFGPVLVARQPMALADLVGRRVGIRACPPRRGWCCVSCNQGFCPSSCRSRPSAASSSVWMRAASTQPC